MDGSGSDLTNIVYNFADLINKAALGYLSGLLRSLIPKRLEGSASVTVI